MAAHSHAGTGEVLIDGVANWLMDQALGDADLRSVFRGCCERLLAADLPLLRAYLGYRALHPLFRAVSLRWERGGGLEITEHPHEPMPETFRRGPHFHMLSEHLPALRRRLAGPEATLDFPVLEELAAQGATDYLAYAVPFGSWNEDALSQDGIIGSWATGRASGFSDADVRALLRIERRLAVACKVATREQTTRNILAAYLGPDAGERVLRGTIRRGDGETIHAVICFSDLRDSTRLSETMPRAEFLDALNRYFECVAGAVLDHGGEVLRFIGDAMLAIFPMRTHDAADPEHCPVHRAACEAALAAASDALVRMEALNAERARDARAPLACGIGLHVGDVMFGNIGVPARLEFSVVGAATNVAARIESLCKPLGRPLLVSADFAAILPGDWEALGVHPLPGVETPHAVYAPAPAAARGAGRPRAAAQPRPVR